MTYVPYHEEGTITLIAGPCSIESEEQMDQVGALLARLGVTWLRGGAYKPRTSPYSFQGLGEEGLKIMQDTAKRYDLQTITEVVDSSLTQTVHDYVDALQIGTRNMANFELLKKIGAVTGESKKPVLFKRGMAATIDEWLAATEYISMGGNPNIMLCERGIRTFETSTRFTLDISAVPVVQKRSLFPVCVDVSHPVGQADLVPPVTKAAIAAGCDSIIMEIHPNPREAKSDGPQSLTLEQFEQLYNELLPIAEAVGKKIV